MNGLTPKSLLVDKLRPELGAKIVKILADDNERAQREKRERAARKRKAADKTAAAGATTASVEDRAD